MSIAAVVAPPTFAAMVDIRYWWGWVKNDLQGICPNCLTDMSNFPPEYNLSPHFFGGCKEIR